MNLQHPVDQDRMLALVALVVLATMFFAHVVESQESSGHSAEATRDRTEASNDTPRSASNADPGLGVAQAHRQPRWNSKGGSKRARGPVISLQQMLIGEAGTLADRDHAAMLHAFERLRRAVGTLDKTLANHIPWWTNGYPPNRPWVAEIDTGCERPPSFPLNLRWSGARQHGCFRVVAAVRAFRAGKLQDPCKGAPTQWRSRKFPKLQRAARRRGWRRIGCGPDTLHVYWEIR